MQDLHIRFNSDKTKITQPNYRESWYCKYTDRNAAKFRKQLCFGMTCQSRATVLYISDVLKSFHQHYASSHHVALRWLPFSPLPAGTFHYQGLLMDWQGNISWIQLEGHWSAINLLRPQNPGSMSSMDEHQGDSFRNKQQLYQKLCRDDISDSTSSSIAFASLPVINTPVSSSVSFVYFFRFWSVFTCVFRGNTVSLLSHTVISLVFAGINVCVFFFFFWDKGMFAGLIFWLSRVLLII